MRVCAFKMEKLTVEIFLGGIPDIFRKLHFGPVTEFELPDAKVSDEEFQEWLSLYRTSWSNGWFEKELLEEAQCN